MSRRSKTAKLSMQARKNLNEISVLFAENESVKGLISDDTDTNIVEYAVAELLAKLHNLSKADSMEDVKPLDKLKTFINVITSYNEGETKKAKGSKRYEPEYIGLYRSLIRNETGCNVSRGKLKGYYDNEIKNMNTETFKALDLDVSLMEVEDVENNAKELNRKHLQNGFNEKRSGVNRVIQLKIIDTILKGANVDKLFSRIG